MTLVLCLLASPRFASGATAPDPAEQLLERHCVDCHGGKQRKAGLDLTTRESLLIGSDGGPAVIPGKPAESALLKSVLHEIDPGMPYKKPQLVQADIRVLHDWIKAGAPYSRKLRAVVPSSDEQEKEFWSFVPLRTPPLPTVKDRNWLRNPIDQFLVARWEKAQLPVPRPLSKLKLVRRVYYDVTGLPPSPEQVDAFLKDDRPQAYEHLVDSLLASPRYGERWARHWLDLARYADSNGYERDLDRPNAWHYRDFVIDALNADMPYDQFLKWQIAGDEYAPEDPVALAATGFCAAGPRETSQITEKSRYNDLDDMLATTGSAVLGLTLGCARCHDHKYDPISQREYYQLLAAFTTSEARDIFITPPRLKQVYEAQDAKFKKARAAHDRWVLRQSIKHETETSGELEKRLTAAELGEWETLKKRKAVELQATWRHLVRLHVLNDKSPERAPTHVLLRGEPSLKGDQVQLAFPAALTRGDPACAKPTPLAKSTGQRRVLAEWLVDVQQGAGSLAARVMANRLWQHHFGEGLVKTPSDFGYQGERPALPELLEWLASQWVAQGWRLKPLHRMILLSAAYQQQSQAQPAPADPENNLWNRRTLTRLEAEILRDAMLSVSGSLNEQMHGPGIRPWIHADVISTGSTAKWPMNVQDGPETWRRSAYLYIKRSVLMPMMEVFDCSDTTFSCGARQKTTVPAQALELLNSAFVRDQAKQMAGRLIRETDGSLHQLVERAFYLAFSRPCTSNELLSAKQFLSETGPTHKALADLCHVLLNSNEFIHVD